MNFPLSIQVECGEFGAKLLAYPDFTGPPSELRRLTSNIELRWSDYWPRLRDATSEMAEQVQGIYDFDASFRSHPFEVQIYHYEVSDGTEYLMLRVKFLDSKSQLMCPVFDTTFEGLDIVHRQPCF